ncbi:hypothetical protein SAMN05444008_10188 [Cnuella takakiae]|uniref:Uncharacterized protein n=1 Tax=Cnuella takakiae TaxID=1302690 RepID=A0A1M4SDN8_9BACT|nr:hypothetical protein [Cnuella takakiae]OLY94475.1 hypothetical protein BUE76_23300 [Cnuella takakiae]SHE30329.1 hypothetical protein SAMN05444008_10188 [Cnuella takakiae]
MLKEISWNSYWTFIALSVTVYYLVVLVYFRIKAGVVLPNGTKAFWQKQQPETREVQMPSPVISGDVATDFLYPEPESAEYPVYACVDEVNAYLEEARRHKGDKEELVVAIGQIVAKYPTIKDSEYQASLSNVIVTQCAHLCFIHLSDADLDRVWQG